METICFNSLVRSATPETEREVIVAPVTAVLEQGHVYVHCRFRNGPMETLIRIWSSTVLIDRSSGSRSSLIHAEQISIAPVWTPVPPNREFRFLLIFQALPAGCTVFEMLEDIPEIGGFHVTGIIRNESDIYHVDLGD